jgi:hypothetical protein
MSVTHGFGLVVSFSRWAIATATRLHFANRPDLARFQRSVDVGGATAAVDLTLGEPQVVLRAEQQGKVQLLFPYAGSVVENGSSVEVFVELVLTVPIEAKERGVAARLAGATVDATRLTFGEVSPALKAFLESATVRDHIKFLLAFQQDLEITLPFGQLSFPLAPLGQAKLRVANDGLLLALPILGLPLGSLDALAPFHGSADVAIAQSALAVDLGFAVSGPALLQKQVGSVGTVKSVNCALGQDVMVLRLVLDDTTINATTQIDLTTSSMKLKILGVDVQPPWWVWFLGIGLFLFSPALPATLLVYAGLAPLLKVIMPMVLELLNQQINAQFARRFEFEVAPNVRAAIYIKAVEINPQDLIIRTRLSAVSDEANSQLSCPASVPPTREVAAALALQPGLVNANDRSASLLWKVTNLATNQVILEEDRTLTSAGADRLSVGTFPPDTKLRIEVSLMKWDSRAQGAARLSRSQIVTVIDRLNSAKPFVQWSHFVTVPQRRRVAGSSQVVVGSKPIFRNSKIHKTDFSTRCRDADRFSPQVAQKLVYSSVLPADGSLLCKTCFP